MIFRRICILLACAMALGAAPAAFASPQAVLDDYDADGVIDSRYSLSDLREALEIAASTPQLRAYGDVASAIGAAQDEALAGVRRDGVDPTLRSDQVGRDPRSADLEGLPSPPLLSPEGGVPWPFWALTALAGFLVIGGATTGVLRRTRRWRRQ